VYKRAKSGDASFFCSRCGLDFATTDPLEAFQGFAHHQQGCASVRNDPFAVFASFAVTPVPITDNRSESPWLSRSSNVLTDFRHLLR
jgi:hypothetical protein